MNNIWPNDADGDILRKLLSNGFDFTEKYKIDFCIDFNNWPQPDGVKSVLYEYFTNLKVFEHEKYMLGVIHDYLTYDLVIKVQGEVTNLISNYGGACDSWGVLH